MDARAKETAAPDVLFSNILPLFKNAEISKGQTIGSWNLEGEYKDEKFQLQTLPDALSTRKLPSLWLLATLLRPQKIAGTIDMMMRPAGPSTFSNFDFLRYTIETPSGFPEQAVLRTDEPETKSLIHLIKPHVVFFAHPNAKELLVSPKGLRIVSMLAEADRARYGVFRQADFGDVCLASEDVQNIMDTLIALQADLDRHSG